MKSNILETMARQGSPFRGWVSKAWRRNALRSIGPNDNHRGLDKLYTLPDPWNMDSPREQGRFAWTNRVLHECAGRVGTILELGSGEGHQSQYLSELCDRLDGVDVSERAVVRAQARLPHCRFGVGDVSRLPWSRDSGQKYDLIVACEVLYYLSDIGSAVRDMSRLGDRCFVSFFAQYAKTVAPHLAGLPRARCGWFCHDDCTWLWIYWTPDRPAS